MTDYNSFRAEVKKALALRGWKYKELALATGYKVRTIEAFMCNCRVTDEVAQAIAKALDIPEHMAT